jgi:hypothetical protein
MSAPQIINAFFSPLSSIFESIVHNSANRLGEKNIKTKRNPKQEKRFIFIIVSPIKIKEQT